MADSSKIINFLLENEEDLDSDWKDMISDPRDVDPYDTWFDTYQPIVNEISGNGEDGPFNGCMFETYGPELEYIQQADPKHTWTYVTGDNGEDVIVAGKHYVNRMGYFITKVPWQTGQESFTFGNGDPKDVKSAVDYLLGHAFSPDYVNEWGRMTPRKKLSFVKSHLAEFELENIASEIVAELDRIVTEEKIQRQARNQ